MLSVSSFLIYVQYSCSILSYAVSKKASIRIRPDVVLSRELALTSHTSRVQYSELTEVQNDSTGSCPLDVGQCLRFGDFELALGGLGWCYVVLVTGAD